ncbi:MAG: SDR family NAD(P)-dependent oxidoreductase [Acidimicrobiales bacterium]
MVEQAHGQAQAQALALAQQAPLQGRVALVSGGGRGIGRAICLGLAEDGADVVVNYRRDAEAAAATVADIEALGRRALAVAASVDDYDACRHLVDAATTQFGPVDILVNNGAIASAGRSVADTDPAEMERVVRSHAFGAWNLCNLVLPGMRTRPRGDIVMISSVASMSNNANGAPYNMGKAALEALAFTLAKEERPHGIHVNVVAPGLVETDMGRRLARAVAGVTDMRSLDQIMPFGRVCQPRDVADVVRFFCGPAAGYLSGEKLNVWGGGQDWRNASG